MRAQSPRSTPEVRVAIAKDVIKHIITDRTLRIAGGTYFRRGDRVCQVCALGGMTLAALRQRQFANLIHQGERAEDFAKKVIKGELNTHDKLVGDVLETVFSRDQLALIEAAFERARNGAWADDLYNHVDEELADDAISFYSRNKDDDEDSDPDKRLELIMQNIIDNNGTFVP